MEILSDPNSTLIVTGTRAAGDTLRSRVILPRLG